MRAIVSATQQRHHCLCVLLFVLLFLTSSDCESEASSSLPRQQRHIRLLFFGDSIMHCSGVSKTFESGFLSYRLPLIRRLLAEQQKINTAGDGKKEKATPQHQRSPHFSFETVGPHVGCNKKLDAFLNARQLFGGGGDGVRYMRHDSFFGRPLSEAVHDLKTSLLTHRPNLVVFSLGVNDIIKGAGATKLLALYESAFETFSKVGQEIHDDHDDGHHHNYNSSSSSSSSSSILSHGVLFLSMIPLDVNRPKVVRRYRKASQRVNETNELVHARLFSSWHRLKCKNRNGGDSNDGRVVTDDEKDTSSTTDFDSRTVMISRQRLLKMENKKMVDDDENNRGDQQPDRDDVVLLHPLCPKRRTQTTRKWFCPRPRTHRRVIPMYLVRVDKGFHARQMTYDAIHPNTVGEIFLASKVFPALAHMMWADNNKDDGDGAASVDNKLTSPQQQKQQQWSDNKDAAVGVIGDGAVGGEGRRCCVIPVRSSRYCSLLSPSSYYNAASSSLVKQTHDEVQKGSETKLSRHRDNMRNDDDASTNVARQISASDDHQRGTAPPPLLTSNGEWSIDTNYALIMVVWVVLIVVFLMRRFGGRK